MITFPNCKINIGLNITGKRDDGYHNLETLFYPVPLTDALEVIVSPRLFNGEKCRLLTYGNAIEGNTADNLVVKAYRLLDSLFDLPPVEVHLLKHIPMGAGLGGGSANAAFMLKMLDEMFRLGLEREQLEEHAATLGADCPFFIANRPTLAGGIGEVFRATSLSLAGWGIAIVKPPVHISTREAFAHITPHRPARPLGELVALPVEEWRERVVNDFEESILPRHREVAAIKQQLYDAGAVYASMSGSGSAVYGLFRPGSDIPPLSVEDKCFLYSGVLQ